MFVRGHVGRRLLLVLLAAGLSLPAQGGRRGSIGFVKADPYAKSGRRPTLYHPGNLFDGRIQTAFCVEREAPRRRILIGLKGGPRVTALRITNGDQRSPSFFERHARVAKLVVRDAEYERVIELPDGRETLTVKLDPPVRSEWMELRIEKTHGDGPLVCLSDVLPLRAGHVLPGTERLKYNRAKERLLGAWAAGPRGAPEKFLTFYADGSFRWVYAPNDPDIRGRTLSGRWAAKGRRLEIRLHGKTLRLRWKRRTVRDEADEAMTQLELSGQGPLADTYRDRWIGGP